MQEHTKPDRGSDPDRVFEEMDAEADLPEEGEGDEQDRPGTRADARDVDRAWEESDAWEGEAPSG